MSNSFLFWTNIGEIALSETDKTRSREQDWNKQRGYIWSMCASRTHGQKKNSFYVIVFVCLFKQRLKGRWLGDLQILNSWKDVSLYSCAMNDRGRKTSVVNRAKKDGDNCYRQIACSSVKWQPMCLCIFLLVLLIPIVIGARKKRKRVNNIFMYI
jgi:hypothetical protein